MDEAVGLVVAALSAGAGAGLQDSASAAVRDAYSGLRKLVAGPVHGVALVWTVSRQDRCGTYREVT